MGWGKLHSLFLEIKELLNSHLELKGAEISPTEFPYFHETKSIMFFSFYLQLQGSCW